MSGIFISVTGATYSSLPVNTVAPAITGTATVGSQLTCSTGTWTGSPAPTYTYQWQKGTTNIGGATSSTFTVTLSQAGSTIRCVVTATNSVGAVSANSANTSSVPLPSIGTSIEGGYYAGQISTAGNGTADYCLIVAPVASGESSKQWKTTDTSTSGTSSVIDGPTNSANMNNATHPAAQFCEGLTIGGFSDWYMPAKNELEVCYYNLKPTTTANLTSGGTNTNAVPSRGSNYTSSVPGQTSANDFQTGNTEAFSAAGYWSSTEFSATSAWFQYFSNGGQDGDNKSSTVRVRAIRRVAV